MSFYLGAGGSGKIMHITKGSYSDTAMQAGVLPDTVFHSDLGYVTYELFTGPITHTTTWYGGAISNGEVPLSCIDLITTHSRFYFLILQASDGTWSEHISYISGTSSSLLWFDMVSSSSNYPSTSHRYISIGQSINFHIVVVNISKTTGFIPTTTSGNEVILRHGDIIVKGVDLYDLKYINSSQVNNEDILVGVNNAAIQLVNSTYTDPGSMGIISNSSYTKIFNGSKAIWDTTINRDKIRFDSIYTASVPYGYVVTSYSTTVDYVVFGPGTLADGDMFFMSDISVGATGQVDMDTSNRILRYINGTIVHVFYSYFSFNGIHTASGYLVGTSTGSLIYRHIITITAGGITAVSKGHSLTLYKLK